MMKLSEAIREGCKYGKQLFGFVGYYRGDTCAIGAAYSGAGLNFNADPYGTSRDILVLFPIIYRLDMEPCPECGHKGADLPHLNDAHHMSREGIAEWVEVIERKLGLWDEPNVSQPVTLPEQVNEVVKVAHE